MIQETNQIFKADVMAKNRLQHNVFSRIAYANFMYKKGKTLQSIGKEIKKHHASIIYYCKQHEQLYKYDQDYKLKYDQLQ